MQAMPATKNPVSNVKKPHGRDYYLSLASSGLSMPIGTDLVLNESGDAERARRDGRALGHVIERAAKRWGTPLAIPLMDLRLEKIDLLGLIGVREHDADKFQFSSPLDESSLARLSTQDAIPLCPGSQARAEAIAYIATRTDLLPIGMTIGPFSLATRLMADPVSASGLSGAGVAPEDAPEVLLLQQCLRIAEAAVQRSIRNQIEHGTQAVIICEPAASIAFLSPRQIKAGSDIFEQLVMAPNLRLKSHLDASGVDLVFHDCGELTSQMVSEFAHRLRPVILSLGSSRKLWEDAALVPPGVVLYGNLPTKSFYSDSAMPLEKVRQIARELVENMKASGHPHILGSECDVLFVPDASESIRRKIDAVFADAEFLARR